MVAIHCYIQWAEWVQLVERMKEVLDWNKLQSGLLLYQVKSLEILLHLQKILVNAICTPAREFPAITRKCG